MLQTSYILVRINCSAHVIEIYFKLTNLFLLLSSEGFAKYCRLISDSIQLVLKPCKQDRDGSY